MEGRYNKSYFDMDIMDEEVALSREGYQRIVKHIILDLPPKSKILDVGCGRGAYLKNIHDLRPDLILYGVDIGDVEEYLPDFIVFHKKSAEKLPFKNDEFDLLICFHVLEHVYNPEKCLFEFNRVLKEEGLLYIESPYYKTTTVPDGNMNFWSDPTHIRPYNHSSFHRLLEETGFEILKIKVWRSWITVLLGPYLILKRIFLNDQDALSTFCAHMVGHSIGALGKKLLSDKK
ncbi:MAG: hypothetical protein Kow0019_10290 [Methanobacteriaceae archaeon]